MTGEAISLFWADAWAAARARVSFRLVGRLTFVLIFFGFIAIAIEAGTRARLGPLEDRTPTTFYTRPVPWGDDSPRPPVALGTIDGAPMERRIPVRLNEIPDHLEAAVLAVEDKRFRDHHGIDVHRIGGALLANIRARAIIQGGSTVTQQLAKNLFLSSSRTPLRKLREAAFAVVLEARYDKDAILEAYLNEIYLGQDGGRAIHGVGAAARYYFGKPPSRLTLSESAILAGMIRAPNRHAPSRNPSSARTRRDLVLELMVEQGRIDKGLADRTRRARIVRRSYPAGTVDGRYFRDFVQPAVRGRLPGRGVAVYTTLDATLQRAAERAVRAGLARLGEPEAEAALVAVDPRSGEVLAMVGGRDYGASQFNRASEARRQPGSAFKPIVAVAALERSNGGDPAFTLASVVEDEPLIVRTPGGEWLPANYDGRFRGPVTVREALEQSLNVPFARIGLRVGPRRIAETARRFGITSRLQEVPSLALGSSEVTLLELVRAYGVLAAGGDLAPTRALLGRARHGDTIPAPRPAEVSRVVDPAVAYLVTSALEGAVARGTGRALNQDHRFEGLAGKTGTSNDWRDAWFVAYTPTLAIGVWVGFDDGRSVWRSGAGAALPIAARFLDEAGSARYWDSFEVPEGITEGYTMAGGSFWSGCGSRELFLEGTEPSGGCFTLGASWDRIRQWGGRLGRRAVRLLEDLADELDDIPRR